MENMVHIMESLHAELSEAKEDIQKALREGGVRRRENERLIAANRALRTEARRLNDELSGMREYAIECSIKISKLGDYCMELEHQKSDQLQLTKDLKASYGELMTVAAKLCDIVKEVPSEEVVDDA